MSRNGRLVFFGLLMVCVLLLIHTINSEVKKAANSAREYAQEIAGPKDSPRIWKVIKKYRPNGNLVILELQEASKPNGSVLPIYSSSSCEIDVVHMAEGQVFSFVFKDTGAQNFWCNLQITFRSSP